MDAIVMGSKNPDMEPATNFKLGVAKYFLEGPNSKDSIDPLLKALWDQKMETLRGEGLQILDIDKKIPRFSENIGGEECLGSFGTPGGPEGGLDGMASFPLCMGEARDNMVEYMSANITPVTGLDYNGFVDAIGDKEIKGLYEGPIASGADFPGYKEAISIYRPALQQAFKEYMPRRLLQVKIFNAS